MRNLLLGTVALLLFVLPQGVWAGGRNTPRKVLWMEAGANLRLLSTPEGVRGILDRAKEAGFDTVVPEAKNAWGYSTYPSRIAPFIGTSPVPRPWPPEYPPPREWYPQDYDLLSVVIQEAHARGMKVHAAVNVFGEALTSWQAGPLYERPEWQAVHYLATRPVLAPDGSSYDLAGVNRIPGVNELTLVTRGGQGLRVDALYTLLTVEGWRVVAMQRGGPVSVPLKGFVLVGHGAAGEWLQGHFRLRSPVRLGPVEPRFVPSTRYSLIAFANPVNPLVRLRMLAFIAEVVTRYPVDGIVLDRIRFPDITADFSETSRRSFEEYLGRKVRNWPEEIFRYEPTEFWFVRRPGPLYKEWLGWRAIMIRRFVEAATRTIRHLRPGTSVAAYVGAWYPDSWNEGVNWANPGYLPPFAWASTAWQAGALADLLDYLLVGLYYREVTIGEAFSRKVPLWRSVSGGALLAKEVAEGTPVLGSVFLGAYRDDPERARAALRTAFRRTEGLMVFDLVYLNLYGWWSLLRH
jgi:uncharacterized lipoprotein YddW (UPF0748 family)